MENKLKRTPLYAEHVKQGGRIIDFGGWELPVQYEGILKEHRMVRQSAGLFDVSHMGEIIIRGREAQKFVQHLVTNDVDRIVPRQTQYSPLCYPDGGCVDDLIVYKFSDDHFFIVVNASNTDKDFDWMTKHAPCDLTVENVSSEFAQLAIQGPKSQSILQKLTNFDLDTIRFFHFEPEVIINGRLCIVSRTGYTGEDGFEIYTNASDAITLWNVILDAGGEAIAPIGLGARDTLRFEAKLPLYGHEISREISPLEAGLGFFVRLDKTDDFIGQDALRRQKSEGLKRALCEFEMIERGIPRAQYKAVSESNDEIGFVTTGMFAPTLEKNIGLAMLPIEYKVAGSRFRVVVRDKATAAEVKTGIFYSKKTRKG